MAGIRALVVDDERLASLILKSILEKKFLAEVDISDNPEEAVKMVKDTTYNLVTSDFSMEPFDGLEFCKRVQKIRKTPFVMVSGQANRRDTREFLRREHHIYGVEKPIDEYTFSKAVRLATGTLS